MFNKGMNALSSLALNFAILALLQGCGGGGGGGGGGRSQNSGTLSLATTGLTFVASGPTAATPPAQRIVGTVTGVTSGTLYLTIVGSGSAIGNISPVLLTSQTTGESIVSVPGPALLGVGTHTGTITVRACLNDPNCSSGSLQGSPATVNVTYHVAAIQPSSTALSYTIANAVATANLSQQVTINTVPAQTWNAATTANWLNVTASGSSGGAMTVSLLQNVLEGMTNGRYEATITLQHSTVTNLTLRVPVTLTIQRTQVNHVSPYVTYTGTASDVIIRGDEFSQVNISGVSFGSTPAQAFTVDSSTQIRATAPFSLSHGRHRVQLQTNHPVLYQLAELVVVDAPQFTATALQYPSAALSAINELRYDAERAALGVSVSRSGSTDLVRFVWSNNAWQPPAAIQISNNYGLALSADGAEWIASADKNITHVDANDFAQVATVSSPLFGSGQQIIAEMAVASDGTVAMFGDVYYGCGATLLLYDTRKRAFKSSPTYPGCRGNIGASGDGSRLLLTNSYGPASLGTGTDDVLSLETSTAALSPTGPLLYTTVSPQLNRTGSRILLNRTRVYDGAYTLLGNLPNSADAAVLSPDGSRALVFQEPNQLKIYDLTASLASSADVYPQLGATIILAQSPGVGTPLYNDTPVHMTTTPDGGTVFVAGKDYLVVQPVP